MGFAAAAAAAAADNISSSLIYLPFENTNFIFM